MLAGCLGVGLLAVVSAALGIVALLYGLASFLYSAWIKGRNGLLANTVVSWLIGAVPITIGVTGIAIDRFAWISVPVFFGVFGREILNDIEDLNGDRVLNRPTVPLLFGSAFAFRLAAASWACFLLVSYLPLVVSPQSRTAGFVLTSLVLSAPVVAIILVLLRERHNLLTRLQLLTKGVLCAYVVVALAAPGWHR